MAYNYTVNLSNASNTYHAPYAGSYLIHGNYGDDRIYTYNTTSTTSYGDYVDGGNDDDVIYTYGGADQLNGGNGNDYLYGGTGNDKLYGQAGSDHMYGEDGNDYMSGGSFVDVLGGGAGIDRIYGGTSGDTLSGGSSTDYLYGDADNDTLYGGTGSDYLQGGDGNDRFVFQNGLGNDRVDDFVHGQDKLYIDVDGYNDTGDMTYTYDANGDYVVHFGSQGSITLTNVATVYTSDFVFI